MVVGIAVVIAMVRILVMMTVLQATRTRESMANCESIFGERDFWVVGQVANAKESRPLLRASGGTTSSRYGPTGVQGLGFSA